MFVSVLPETVGHQAPLSVGFHRQEYWIGLPFPSPGDLTDTRIKPYCRRILYQVHAKSLQSFLTLCDPMDYSLPGSSVHGVLQARILDWVAMLSSRRSF